ncbi:MAG TPA: hypothetical protein VIK33_04190 [Anaerolineae bacterium]
MEAKDRFKRFQNISEDQKDGLDSGDMVLELGYSSSGDTEFLRNKEMPDRNERNEPSTDWKRTRFAGLKRMASVVLSACRQLPATPCAERN